MAHQLRLLFGTDFHGSDLCFRKFIGAALAYEVDVVVIGGDITGKGIVPVVAQSDGSYKAYLFDVPHLAKGEAELQELKRRISAVGFYPYVTSAEEAEAINREEKRLEGLFAHMMTERLREWLALAKQHLEPRGIRCVAMPGNDDPFYIDDVLNESDFVVNGDMTTVALAENLYLVCVGWNNITPWHCYRDISEEELEAKIEEALATCPSPQNAIFAFHCPPYNTKIDQVPALDADLRIQHKGGQILMKPAGSIAVRRAIERYQPLLGLHGHVHEGRGFERIGHTLCLNPGSEYAEGIMRAAVVNFKNGKLQGHLLISG